MNVKTAFGVFAEILSHVRFRVFMDNLKAHANSTLTYSYFMACSFSKGYVGFLNIYRVVILLKLKF